MPSYVCNFHKRKIIEEYIFTYFCLGYQPITESVDAVKERFVTSERNERSFY